MVEIEVLEYLWLNLANVFLLVWCTDKLLESSTRYHNWKHKRRIKKSDYVLSEKDVVIHGE